MTIAQSECLAGKEPREPRLGSREFRRVVELIKQRAGISLADSKRDMVHARLSRRLRTLSLTSFDEYLDLLGDPHAAETEHFVNALTTNLTSFFREPHHFEYLARQWLPTMLAETRNRDLRIWSAGCSSGEEPYSIAMTLLDHLPANRGFRILATDLDSETLARADAGIYPVERIEGIANSDRHRWFQRGQGSREGFVRVRPTIRETITFRRLNLFDPWPMKDPIDAIFCRNVVIYFSKDTQRPLFDRFADALTPNGHLFIGHSESLHGVCDRFESLGHTIYRRQR